jgi:hypothetical protein
VREKDSTWVVRRIELTGDLDRHAAEALQLEIRRLAKRYGIEIEEFRIEEAGETDSST